MDETIINFIRLVKTGITNGTVFTGSVAKLALFRDHLVERLRQESIRVIPVDLSGQWLSDDKDIEEPEPRDLIMVWGLECLSPQDTYTYSLRTTLDEMQHEGVRFVIFCEAHRYREHFCSYSAPLYHFCLRLPVDD